jgi:hypothetical protein
LPPGRAIILTTPEFFAERWPRASSRFEGYCSGADVECEGLAGEDRFEGVEA